MQLAWSRRGRMRRMLLRWRLLLRLRGGLRILRGKGGYVDGAPIFVKRRRDFHPGERSCKPTSQNRDVGHPLLWLGERRRVVILRLSIFLFISGVWARWKAGLT